MRDPRSKWTLVGCFVMFVAISIDVHGQSTILNIPSAEIMSRHQLYVEADLIAHPTEFKNGGFLWYGPSVIYGISKNVEIGVNAYVIKDAGPTQGFELQPNAKWKFFNDEDKGLSAAAGVMMFLPLTR